MRIDDYLTYMCSMTGTTDGPFSRNFALLQLQLKTLLEEAGGDHLLEFLDTMVALNRSEQRIALSIFSQVVARIAAGPVRLETAADKELKKFEEDLHADLLSAMREAALSSASGRIEVLPGGKDEEQADNGLIDLARERRRRKKGQEPIIN